MDHIEELIKLKDTDSDKFKLIIEYIILNHHNQDLKTILNFEDAQSIYTLAIGYDYSIKFMCINPQLTKLWIVNKDGATVSPNQLPFLEILIEDTKETPMRLENTYVLFREKVHLVIVDSSVVMKINAYKITAEVEVSDGFKIIKSQNIANT